MYFHKIRHPINFSFIQKFNRSSRTAEIVGKRYSYELADLGSDIFRLQVKSSTPLPNLSQSDLQSLPYEPSEYGVDFGPRGEISLHGPGGKPLLQSSRHSGFGVCGKSWLFSFECTKDMEFYGMGEKNIGFERSGKRTKFWNTDVWGDFSLHEMRNASTDPMYVNVPYLVIKQGNTYVGILVDNPFPVFMDTGSNFLPPTQLDPADLAEFFLGADEGAISLYFLVGPSLHDLTCKFQRLCGTTPLPPLWALGHHQCRWGYFGPKDLSEIDRKFTKYKIPNDGLWLDIDYMEGYKVFTFSSEHFKNPTQEITALNKQNRHVVPILDPGVKIQSGYNVYEDGVKSYVFCKTPQGGDYVGFVWPGKTVFPDFSLSRVRSWWANYVKAFANTGVSGAWLDMNDPSVGPVELDDMLFGNGAQSHASFHNQYALGMAKASHAGFLEARPDKRPFLISRSGFTGQSKYSAVWTGDNYSNEHHMKNAVQVTLNLALSGIPFNGPDVPGFGGDATPELAIAWYKAGFLFPFFRNHSHHRSSCQELWIFDARTRENCIHYVRTRYKLLPYLYNLFIDQEEHGTAILRPLFYDFRDTIRLPLGKIDDQFLVGPSVLQAPIYDENAKSRPLVLPGANPWFAAHEGRWVTSNRRVSTKQTDASTPIYIREGAIIPMQSGIRTDNHNDLSEIELHLFLRRTSRITASYQYRFDDGESFEYRNGKRTSFQIHVTVRRGNLCVQFSDIQNGYRSAKVRFVVYDKFNQVVVKGLEQKWNLELKAHKWDFVGKALTTAITSGIPVV